MPEYQVSYWQEGMSEWEGFLGHGSIGEAREALKDSLVEARDVFCMENSDPYPRHVPADTGKLIDNLSDKRLTEVYWENRDERVFYRVDLDER